MNEMLSIALEAISFGIGLLTPFIIDELWRRWKNKRRRQARYMEVT